MIGWIDEAKNRVRIPQAAAAFGLRVTGSFIRPCPACRAESRSRTDRRPPVWMDDHGWRCRACDAKGSVIDFVAWCMTSQPFDPKNEAVKAWFDGDPATAPLMPAPPPITPKSYPPTDRVAELWDACMMVCDVPAVAAWLRSRGLDADAIEDRDVARALPDDAPDFAQGWVTRGYRCILPMYDLRGRLRSLRARRVVDGDGPKSLAPSGHRAGGLVFADALAQRTLRAGTVPAWWPSDVPFRITIVEGGPAWLAGATAYSDAAVIAPAVFGIGSGAWTDAIASRIPDGSDVLVITDPDAAGARYTATIVATLANRCTLREKTWA